MKKLFAFLLLIVAAASVHAQHANISPAFSFLYKGIWNYVEVGLPGIAADSITLTAHHSGIRKENNWLWMVNPDTSFSQDTLVVTAWRKRKKVYEDSSVFRLKWCPDPVVAIGGHTGIKDSLSKEALIASVAIVAFPVNVEMDMFYNVVHFALVVNSGPAVYLNNSQFLSELQRSVIQQTKPGDIVHFYGIMVKYPDGRIKEAGSIAITIK